MLYTYDIQSRVGRCYNIIIYFNKYFNIDLIYISFKYYYNSNAFYTQYLCSLLINANEKHSRFSA